MRGQSSGASVDNGCSHEHEFLYQRGHSAIGRPERCAERTENLARPLDFGQRVAER